MDRRRVMRGGGLGALGMSEKDWNELKEILRGETFVIVLDRV